MTQVPPNLFASTAIVFAPCTPDALLAVVSPPLPPPMTKKSHSFVIGAIFLMLLENCLRIPASLVVVCAALAVGDAARVMRVKVFICLK